MLPQKLSGLSDEALLQEFQAGNIQAFELLYNRYKGLLYVHAYKMLRDEDEAKDVVQELFAKLYTRAGTICLKTTFSAYLYASVRNRILDIIAHTRIKTAYLASLGEFLDQGTPTTDQLMREKELAFQIEKEVSLLPEKMRLIFEMSRKSSLSHKEIAARLDISDKTVKKQINNAIKLIKVKLHLLDIAFVAGALFRLYIK
ncbi:RNA polymerase sigma-70 factor [Mucilaginibacter sp.]|uniref:RNA polymerase sigma factor n=1 Tax=Mucilaginibacter sp. TaxID=1882438 RepID=UPI002842F668|nr:RNA polymerase sigma-70 factor [Mucilaginibacter sp.]MDR3693779.1 RNA polymerase sigma-70 factor [Mucilaginibacter sp.]